MKAHLLKRLHLIGAFWFIGCVGFLVTIALRQAGFNWWVIFSLSGHSLVVLFLLLSLYLTSLFRGGGSQVDAEAVEHPLTTSEPYGFLYVTTPLLGALAGLLALQPQRDWLVVCHTVALATFGATLFVWLVLDPTLGILETLTPLSRRHRERRLEALRQEKRQRQIRRDALLAEVTEREQANRQRWSEQLEPCARELAELLAVDARNFRQAGQRAARLGVMAYRLGGIRCMRLLHEMAVTQYHRQHPEQRLSDYIVFWWDGIGTWHSPATE